ncbi:MAG: MFS transporter [bacterium]|nr:MFS transporter [bacterium]
MPIRKPEFRSIFRALKSRNYRLYFTGQGVSLIGSWMQSVAMGWLVYRLTHSAFLLGVIGFTSQIPSLFLGPLAGVLADRMDKRRLLLIIQAGFMLQASLLAGLVLTDRIGVPSLIGLSLWMGLVNAFDVPVRQSMVVQLVERPEDLANAIALNSMMFNGARLIGPSIAGLILAAAGEGVCFLLNAVSFTAVIGALWAMKPVPGIVSRKRRIGAELRDGFRYAWGFLPIRSILTVMALISLFGMSYHVLLPVFAKEILGGGPHTLGFLMGATGVGAVFGAFAMASRTSPSGLEKVLPAAGAVFGLGLIVMSFSRSPLFSYAVMAVIGLGMMTFMISCNTLIQTLVDEDKRGRVMALYAMAFMGTTPLGALLVGSLADRIGAPAAAAVGGLLCLVCAAWFLRKLPQIRREAHPVWISRGYAGDVSEGMEAASEMTTPKE